MVRRIIVIFFILANLILQVNTVFACGLTGGLTTSTCCCSHEIRHDDCAMDDHCPVSNTSRQDPCCSITIAFDTRFISEVCGPTDFQKTWIVSASPSLTVIVNMTDTVLLQAAVQHPSAVFDSFSIYPKLPLYLATNRLRI